MLWKKINAFVLLFLCVTAPLWAQQQMSLQELVQTTLEENYQIKIVRNQQQMAENLNTPGNAGFLPRVDFSAEQSWGIQNTEQRFFDGGTRSGDNAASTRQDAMVEANWLVFDGFRMFARRDQLQHLAQLSRLETKYYIEQTIADIAFLFYQLVKEKTLLESSRESLSVSDFRLALEAEKRAIGAGNALLYHQALIDFNADSSLVAHHKMVIRELQIQINRLINADPESIIQPEGYTMSPSEMQRRSALLQKAVENNKELQMEKLNELITDSELRMERSVRYPQISLFANYAYGKQTNEVGFVESSKAYGGQYGVRIRFNLFDGGQQNTRIQNYALQQQSTLLSREDTQAMINSRLSVLLNRHRTFIRQYNLLTESVRAAESSLAIAQEQLQEGAISGFEFRQAQINSLTVNNQLIELLFSIKAVEISIYQLTGELTQKLL